MNEIESALRKATDTKACVIGSGATERAAKMFREIFPAAQRAIVVSDPRTREVAGARVVELLKASGVEVSEHVICADGSWFHATYDKVEEVRNVISTCNRTIEQSEQSNNRTIPVAVGSGTVNDLVKRAASEMAKKYSTPDELRRELGFLKSAWPELSAKLRAQIMPFDEVRAKLKQVGAPYEPEMIGVSRARFRETYRGVPYMRARYFSLDLVSRLGLMTELLDRLFGPGGVWEVG